MIPGWFWIREEEYSLCVVANIILCGIPVSTLVFGWQYFRKPEFGSLVKSHPLCSAVSQQRLRSIMNRRGLLALVCTAIFTVIVLACEIGSFIGAGNYPINGFADILDVAIVLLCIFFEFHVNIYCCYDMVTLEGNVLVYSSIWNCLHNTRSGNLTMDNQTARHFSFSGRYDSCSQTSKNNWKSPSKIVRYTKDFNPPCLRFIHLFL